MKTYSAKPADISRRWLLVDASEAPLGRVATQIATYLTGKNKPGYTPHMDGGDYVVVINAAQLVVTGNKLVDKKYYHYSGYPGGMKETALRDKLQKSPESVIKAAVRGMLPKNKLLDDRLARLRIFAGEAHDHSAQQPEKITVRKAKEEVKHG